MNPNSIPINHTNSNIESDFPAIHIIRKGKMAAAEIPAVKSSRRAWLAIYPLFPYAEYRHKGDYRFRVFEVEKTTLEYINDVWEETMEKRADEYISGEVALLARVRDFIEPSKVGKAWKCEYPV